MTSATAFPIFTLVSGTEQLAAAAAAALLSQGLSQQSPQPYVCACTVLTSHEDIPANLASPLLVTSFFSEVDRLEEPWTETKDRLRNYYRGLVEAGRLVFLCTTFRSVTPSEPTVVGFDKRLLKIRRLNLLAATLSQELGLFVVDLDRALADVGAQALQTDHRLEGAAAAAVAGKTIALTIIANGLDNVASFELQDAAKALVEAYRPAIEGLGDRSAKLVGSNVMSIGRGRHKQVAATRVESLQDRQADRLVALFLKGQLSPRDAVVKIVGGVRRRGLGPSASLIASSLIQAVRGKPQ